MMKNAGGNENTTFAKSTELQSQKCTSIPNIYFFSLNTTAFCCLQLEIVLATKWLKFANNKSKRCNMTEMWVMIKSTTDPFLTVLP